ncbi:hypothetical protein JW949_03720 [Candidatus Woesearchaeota archaeon]|nr:hypothetical protein [Candidatus Woesearchaeota archaeon]
MDNEFLDYINEEKNKGYLRDLDIEERLSLEKPLEEKCELYDLMSLDLDIMKITIAYKHNSLVKAVLDKKDCDMKISINKNYEYFPKKNLYDTVGTNLLEDDRIITKKFLGMKTRKENNKYIISAEFGINDGLKDILDLEFKDEPSVCCCIKNENK